jgi:hypothetical protein
MKPTEDLVITYPEDSEGNPVVKSRFMVTLSKRLHKVEKELQKALALDGIDHYQTVGFYTFEVVIARTFDVDEVTDELKRRLKDDVLSDIITPNKEIVTP